jgi:hypothetical protein
MEAAGSSEPLVSFQKTIIWMGLRMFSFAGAGFFSEFKRKKKNI